MKILCFEVETTDSHINKDVHPTSDLTRYINWSVSAQTSAASLTKVLEAQSIVNHANLYTLYTSCLKGHPYIIENTVDQQPSEDMRKYAHFFGHVPTALCEKYRLATGSMLEVLERDQMALTQYDFNVRINAVVLLDNKDHYYGHIYAWLSPAKPNVCLAMGIRTRIDMLFLRHMGSTMRNLSHNLIDGVAAFAQKHGCDTVVITNPLPIMIPILTKLGFEPTSQYDDEDTGQSISVDGACSDDSCYHKNITDFDPEFSLNQQYLYYTLEQASTCNIQ